MKFRNFFKIFLLLAFVLLISCGEKKNENGNSSAQTGTEKKGKKFKIAIMPKLTSIPYFEQTGEGAKKAGEELGVEVIYIGPNKADAAEQVKMIEDLINQGVDAIAVAPNDPAAVVPVLQQAKAAGIMILDWDTPTDINVVDASIHQIDDKVLGEHLFDKLVEKMGTDAGEYAIITGGLSAANLNSWIDYGLKYAKEKYPNGLTEYSQIIRDYHRIKFQPGMWSDDTDMMLCIANAIIEDKGINLHTIARNFKDWFYAPDTRGVGQTTYKVLAIADYVEKPQQVAELIWKMSHTKNAANGAVMRTSSPHSGNQNGSACKHPRQSVPHCSSVAKLCSNNIAKATPESLVFTSSRHAR